MAAAADPVGPFLSESSQEDGSPGAEGAPRFRDLPDGWIRAVPLGDLARQLPLVVGHGVGGVGPAEDDEFGGERPEPLHLLHGSNRLIGLAFRIVPGLCFARGSRGWPRGRQEQTRETR